MKESKKRVIRRDRTIVHNSTIVRVLFFAFLLSSFIFTTPVTAQVRITTDISNTEREGINGIRNGLQKQGQQQNSRYGSDSTYSDTSATKGLIFHEEIPDSVLRNKVFFFHYTPREVKISDVWNPSLDPTGAQFSDPLDALNGNYYLGKGTIGHPHTAIFPAFGNGLSLRLQGDEMNGYVKTPENIRLYQTMTPYTLLSYNSSLKKDYRAGMEPVVRLPADVSRGRSLQFGSEKPLPRLHHQLFLTRL